MELFTLVGRVSKGWTRMGCGNNDNNDTGPNGLLFV